MYLSTVKRLTKSFRWRIICYYKLSMFLIPKLFVKNNLLTFTPVSKTTKLLVYREVKNRFKCVDVLFQLRSIEQCFYLRDQTNALIKSITEVEFYYILNFYSVLISLFLSFFYIYLFFSLCYYSFLTFFQTGQSLYFYLISSIILYVLSYMQELMQFTEHKCFSQETVLYPDNNQGVLSNTDFYRFGKGPSW